MGRRGRGGSMSQMKDVSRSVKAWERIAATESRTRVTLAALACLLLFAVLLVGTTAIAKIERSTFYLRYSSYQHFVNLPLTSEKTYEQMARDRLIPQEIAQLLQRIEEAGLVLEVSTWIAAVLSIVSLVRLTSVRVSAWCVGVAGLVILGAGVTFLFSVYRYDSSFGPQLLSLTAASVTATALCLLAVAGAFLVLRRIHRLKLFKRAF